MVKNPKCMFGEVLISPQCIVNCAKGKNKHTAHMYTIKFLHILNNTSIRMHNQWDNTESANCFHI